MVISAEISFYPLQEAFKPPVKAVIARFQQCPGVEVVRTSMSTMLFGELEQVTAAVHDTMAWAFSEYQSSIFVVKYLSSDRRPDRTE